MCREYLPSQEAALRRELGQRSAGLDGANALEEARKWLDLGEVRPALDTLILNPQAPRSYLIRAADILLHQADPETAAEVGGDLGARLFSIGEHALAAQVIFPLTNNDAIIYLRFNCTPRAVFIVSIFKTVLSTISKCCTAISLTERNLKST